MLVIFNNIHINLTKKFFFLKAFLIILWTLKSVLQFILSLSKKSLRSMATSFFVIVTFLRFESKGSHMI